MRLFLSDGKVHEIVDFGSLPVFSKASTYPAIFLLSPSPKKSLNVKKVQKKEQLDLKSIQEIEPISILANTLSDDPWNLGDLDIPKLLKEKGIDYKTIDKFGKAYYSIVTGMDKVFVVNKDIIIENNLEEELIFPYAYKGAEIFRYAEIEPKNFVIYPYTETDNGTPKLIPESKFKI